MVTPLVHHLELGDCVKDPSLFLAVSEQDVPWERDLFFTKPALLPAAWDPAAHRPRPARRGTAPGTADPARRPERPLRQRPCSPGVSPGPW
ncbi:hypothetical protein [Streptomyces uncialis]|uniref:hypothetical protein n=1 Tax=Streptomyces uncialis TaxID=1048205 RepID=UPI002252AC00|nr:hypothetical protein [Streptomyces uncialis]MCX4661951.1 hypothetical protein [Streptomyces uncialis]